MNIFKKISGAVLIIAMAAAFLPALRPSHADAAVSSWQKGFSIQSRYAEDFGSDSFKQSVKNAQALGTNYISLIVPYYQSNIGSTDVAAGWNTPSDENLVSAIKYIHGLGMSVVIKPHLESHDGSWRARINPGNREEWFKNYGSILNHLADISKAESVEGIVVGTELISMAANGNESNTENWNALIGSVRDRYSGFLTYSANWGGDSFGDEINRIGFWGSLDYIGISAYFNLYSQSNSVSDLKNVWDTYNREQIKPLADKYGKQVLFTEVGYRSVNGAHNDPWDSGRSGFYDANEQVNAYSALFEYWNSQPFMVGVHLWEWKSDPDYGGEGNTDYTPQHKPAEDLIKQWFNSSPNPDPDNGGDTGGSTTPPPAGTAYSMSVALSTSQLSAGHPATLSASFGSEANVANALLDVEVYDSQNNKVHQQFFENESLAAGQASTKQVSWTPNSSGEYKVKGGIFGTGWSSNYFWNDNAATLAVGQVSGGGGSTTPPPNPSGGYQTNIWWPTNGSSVQGTQPFKAMLEGLDVGQYKMYWQVDGGQLNEMHDSAEDYPHKEAWVDVSGWKWNSANSYNINFISRNNSGSDLSSKSAGIVAY